MQSIDRLVEQHILESQSRLRHVDELMAKASRAASRASADRSDASTVKRSEGLRSALKSVGLQFEQALTAIFDCRGL